ncbi:peptidase inhibitor family I36 protein [Kitasatospora sp. NPDC057692]|uniref:peptidase inhibitor family I36 protein n=1 Tax=Kitasatospora sp. NPDC057692 TaxID=3346215 RepID=UPI003693CA87
MKKFQAVLTAAVLTAGGVLSAGLVPAAAVGTGQSAVSRPGVVAAYGGRTINLARDGWGGAASCVVRSVDAVRCYRTHEEANRATGYSRATDELALANPGLALPECSDGYVCLYEHIQGRGRRLMFRDDKWQNLGQYGFNDVTSSWRNNQSSDAAGLARDNGGWGGRIWLSGKSYSSDLGAYNDWASSVIG